MDKSRAEKAGKQMGLTIIEMVNLMYQKNTAKNFYNIMKELYGTYLQIEFGKNLIPDLRRKKDTARVLVERTLSDLFVAQQSKNLEKRLEKENRD